MEVYILINPPRLQIHAILSSTRIEPGMDITVNQSPLDH